MTELATRAGPPPAGLPRGECILTSLYDEQGSVTGLHIDRADPHILISAELLAEAYVDPVPGTSLSLPPSHGPGRWVDGFWEGAVLKIAATNGTVIYRLAGYVPAVNAYIAEWPD